MLGFDFLNSGKKDEWRRVHVAFRTDEKRELGPCCRHEEVLDDRRSGGVKRNDSRLDAPKTVKRRFSTLTKR